MSNWESLINLNRSDLEQMTDMEKFEEMIKRLDNLNVNGFVFDVKSEKGVLYSTKIGFTVDKTDIIEKLIEYSREFGYDSYLWLVALKEYTLNTEYREDFINFISNFQLSKLGYSDKNYWQIDKNGKIIDEQFICPTHEGYKQYLLEVVKEIVKLPIKGIIISDYWFDSEACFCERCRQLIKRKIGVDLNKPITTKDFYLWINWKTEVISDFFKKCRDNIPRNLRLIGEIIDIDPAYGYVVGYKINTGLDISLSKYCDEVIFHIAPISGVDDESLKVITDIARYLIGSLDKEIILFFELSEKKIINTAEKMAEKCEVSRILYYLPSIEEFKKL